MKKSPEDKIGFNWTEISLDTARNAVLAGDGNYSDVKQNLLDKLPTLQPDKTVAFGLPKGKEVPEDQRRGLCAALNLTLSHANLPWKVTYSGTQKLFICVPREFKVSQTRGVYKSNNAKFKKICQLAESGLQQKAIAEKLGLNPGITGYYLNKYRQLKGAK